jgi:GABA(A) receptor-associated protein
LPESPEPIRKKFLIPGTISYGQFCHIVKKRVNLNPEEGLVIMIGDIIPVANTSMNEVYKLHKKDESGFLITTLHKEHIFG